MNSLLRADLSRIFKHRSTIYVLFAVMLVITFAYAIIIPIAQDFLKNSGEAEISDIGRTGFAMPLQFAMTALLVFGVVGFLSSWATISVAWADMRSGYDRTIISSIGKRTYYREKFNLSVIISAIFVFGTTIIGSIASGLISGYEDMGSIIDLIFWCTFVTIISWSCACLSLVVLWTTKNSTIAYITAFVLCTGLLSGVIGMFLGNISADVVQTWNDISDWFPKGAFAHLQVISDSRLDLSGDTNTHITITPIVCLAISYYIALHRLTKR